MLGTLIRLQLLAFRRAPHFGGRLVLAAIKALGLAYAVASAALLGFLLPDTLSVMAPGVSALALVEQAMLPALGGLTVLRVLLQDVPTRGAEAFLVLPVERERVARAVVGRSVLSVMNAIPLLFAIPFAARTVRAEAGGAAALWFVAGVAALVALSHLAFVIWKTRLGEAPVQTVALLGGIAAALGGADLALGGGLPGGLVALLRGALGPWLVLSLSLAAFGLALHAWRGLVEALYLDVRARPARRVSRPASTGFTRPGVRTFMELDARQIQRSRYPRGIVLNAAILGLSLTLVGSVGGRDETTLLLVFAAATVAVSAGQFAIPFASGHYDRLLTLPEGVATFVRAKLLLLGASVVALGAVQALVLTILAPSVSNLLSVATAVLFGAGVLAPVAIVGSALAPKPLDTSDRVMMNVKVQSFAAQILIGAVGLLAVGLFLALGAEAGRVSIAALGGVGLAAMPLWARLIRWRIETRRHAVAARFRATL